MTVLDMSNRHWETCPLDSIIKILDGKWKPIIICHLMNCEMYYSDILSSLNNCTKRTLSFQLSQLERDHIIQKKLDDTKKTSYHLTPLGESLVPVIEAMTNWNEMYLATLKQNKE